MAPPPAPHARTARVNTLKMTVTEALAWLREPPAEHAALGKLVRATLCLAQACDGPMIVIFRQQLRLGVATPQAACGPTACSSIVSLFDVELAMFASQNPDCRWVLNITGTSRYIAIYDIRVESRSLVPTVYDQLPSDGIFVFRYRAAQPRSTRCWRTSCRFRPEPTCTTTRWLGVAT